MTMRGSDVIDQVLEATRDLRIEGGFTPKQVIEYIAANYREDREPTSRRVYAALRRGASNGIFRLRKGRYALGAISSFSDVSDYEEPRSVVSSDESECGEPKSSFSSSNVSEFGEPQDCGILTEPKTKKSCKRKKARRRGCTKMWRPRNARKRSGKRKKGRSRSRKSSRRKASCKRARSRSRKISRRKASRKRARPHSRKSSRRKSPSKRARSKARKSLCKRRKSRRHKSHNRRRGKTASKHGKARRSARKARGAKGSAGKRTGKRRKSLCKPKQAAVGGQGSDQVVHSQTGGSCAPQVKMEPTENQ